MKFGLSERGEAISIYTSGFYSDGIGSGRWGGAAVLITLAVVILWQQIEAGGVRWSPRKKALGVAPHLVLKLASEDHILEGEMGRYNAITDVPGIRVGHVTDAQALTGCTVVLCERGAVVGVDQRGGAPGTRETDLARPLHLVQKANAVLLSGGSAFGLDAASGVVRYLEEKGVGFDTGVAQVPIVPAAILYDLDMGDSGVRPDAEMGYAACQEAISGPIEVGNVGAGTGASVGKILGPGRATKSGLGTASIDLGGGLMVGALVAVNAFGDVIDPSTVEIIAGARRLRGGGFADTLSTMRGFVGKAIMRFASRGHTIIGVVATNARLSKEEVNKVAQMAQDGIARAIRPSHTMFDGDTLFALAIGAKKADVSLVGAYGAEAMSAAILCAVREAKSAGGLLAWRDLQSGPG